MAMTWQELETRCDACRDCGLCNKRSNVVFGAGNRSAKVMFIGEGPGSMEDKTGKPFVGRGGKLLDDMLEIIDLDRNRNIYIANMVKCRPPDNRDPLNTEQEACAKWLKAQIELVNPRIIVCLGRIAAAAFIRPDFKISKEHGRFTEKNGIIYMAMYHPAALLRNPANRPDTFLDLKALQAKILEVCPETYDMRKTVPG